MSVVYQISHHTTDRRETPASYPAFGILPYPQPITSGRLASIRDHAGRYYLTILWPNSAASIYEYPCRADALASARAMRVRLT